MFLERIFYAFGETGSVDTSNTFIEFEVDDEERFDSSARYVAGHQFYSNRLLLTSINSYNDYGGQSVKVKSYALNYEFDVDEDIDRIIHTSNRLDSVSECGWVPTKSCKDTDFDWSERYSMYHTEFVAGPYIEEYSHSKRNGELCSESWCPFI